MFKYRVMPDRDAHGHLAMQDSAGNAYRVRALGTPPPVGAMLTGARPHLGFGLLVCAGSGQVYRVIFESLESYVAELPSKQQRTG